MGRHFSHLSPDLIWQQIDPDFLNLFGKVDKEIAGHKVVEAYVPGFVLKNNSCALYKFHILLLFQTIFASLYWKETQKPVD